MFHIIVLLALLSTASAQSIPPDSVWTFAWDNGGDEYFYDAIALQDGYLLCGEARAWNAQAGEALLVKINLQGQLVWARTYPHSRFRRCKSLLSEATFTRVYGEFALESGLSDGLFHTVISDAGDSIASYPLGFADHRVHFWGDVGVDSAGGVPVPIAIYTARDPNGMDFVRKQRGSLIVTLTDLIAVYVNSLTNWRSGQSYGLTCVGRNYHQVTGWDGVWFTVDEGPSGRAFTVSDDDVNACVYVNYNNLVFVGQTRSLTNATADLWVVKDFNGLLLWSRTYGGLAYEDGVEIINANDNGFIIAGNFSSEDINFEQSDFWLLKIDEDGDSVWSVLAGGEEADHCEGMVETQNGFLLFGNSMSFSAPGWDACAMLLAYVPDLAASPASLNFGPTQVDSTTTRALNLINTGSALLTVTDMTTPTAYSTNLAAPLEIEIGDTARVEIYFTPPANGNYLDTLRIHSDGISGTKSVRVLGAGVGGSASDELPLLPGQFRLHPAYPNPFNSSATLRFDLPRALHVKLSLYNSQGQEVAALADGAFPAGSHSVSIEAGHLSSGLYFVNLQSAEFSAAQKVMLIK